VLPVYVASRGQAPADRHRRAAAGCFAGKEHGDSARMRRQRLERPGRTPGLEHPPVLRVVSWRIACWPLVTE
jgi:hypothetical protein